MFAKYIAQDGRFAFSELDNGGAEITGVQHAALMAGQAAGKDIKPDAQGLPVLMDRPEYIPRVVPMRNARLALARAGELPAIQQMIAQMPGSAGDEARIDWEFAQTVDRDSSLVQGLIAARGWSAGTVDALFKTAASIP